MKTEKQQKVRLGIYLNPDIKEYAEDRALYYGMSLSAYITMLIANNRNQEQAMVSLPQFMEQIKELKEQADILGLYEDGDAEGGDLSRKGV